MLALVVASRDCYGVNMYSNPKRPRIQAFTLIELIVVIGIIGILAVIVILAINPARQFAQARNTRRQNDVAALYKAITQHSIENQGVVTSKITTTPQNICNGRNGTVACVTGAIDLYPELVPSFLSNIPSDPSGGTDSNTGYQAMVDSSGRVIVLAVNAELGQTVNSSGGVAIATPTPSPTPTPYAAQFTRTNSEYLYKSSAAGLPSGAEGEVSFAGWFYFDAVGSPTKYLMGAVSADASNRRFYLGQNDSDSRLNFTVLLNNSTYATASSSPVSAGQWYFVVAWYDAAANTVNLQLNNGAVVSTSYASGISGAAVNFYLSSFAGTSGYYDGRIDNVGVWSRVLSSGERTTLYNGGLGQNYSQLSTGIKSSLVSYWNLDELSGTRADAHGSNGLADTNTVTFGPGVD